MPPTFTRRQLLAATAGAVLARPGRAATPEAGLRWLPAHAYHIPSRYTTEESGYQSLGEGKDGKLYIGAAKYGFNAYLLEFDPHSEELEVAIDVMKTIGSSVTGFAAQAKIHTPDVCAPSGRIYCGSKQGYPKEGEKRDDYPGGYPLVFDPKTRSVKAYPIPFPHCGVISHVPDEARRISYISTCDDARPEESSHFMVLDWKTETYRDLGDLHRSFAYIQRDYRERALHVARDARVGAYDPASQQLTMLKMTLDGRRPEPGSFLWENHPLELGMSPEGKTLYMLPLSENALYIADLTRPDDDLPLRRFAPMLSGAPEKGTDCRAVDVDRHGIVWAVVRQDLPEGKFAHHLVRFDPRRGQSRDLGVLYVTNPDYENFTDAEGKPKPWHHGFWTTSDGKLTPLHAHMAIKAARDGTVWVTIIAPFTLLRLTPETLKHALA